MKYVTLEWTKPVAFHQRMACAMIWLEGHAAAGSWDQLRHFELKGVGCEKKRYLLGVCGTR